MRRVQSPIQRTCFSIGLLSSPRLAPVWGSLSSHVHLRANVFTATSSTHIKALRRSLHISPVSRLNRVLTSTIRPNETSSQASISRHVSTEARESQQAVVQPKDENKQIKHIDDDEEDLEELSFAKTEKASAAAQLNLSARLSKEGGDQNKTSSFKEVWRLVKVARPEAKVLGIAFVFLLVSSSISMAVPFSVGKILDMSTSPDAPKDLLFGLDPATFYLGLGGILTLGAAANYGRVILLRIVGERIVTRLRSQLFRNTFIQNAEFFDANRVGDLISRLGSDTIIVGKSITQNLSDGLRSFISGVAGLTLMGYVSLKLSSILAVMFPPIAVGAFFYGRAIRNLSRRIQKNLGTLTKIAEERLGNVRTSQAFAGERQEVHRYNRQTRKIFELGKREAYISATFFSFSGWMGNMTLIATLYVGGRMVQSGTISVGELTSFLMYTAYAGSSVFGLSGFYSELMKGVGAASRLFELQDRRPTISPTVGSKVLSAHGDITFDALSFSYPTRPAVSIFRELSFTIASGTNVAIVAPSGAGKSTVASLLMRFYMPTSGSIKIDGVDIATMNTKQLRRKIGYVGQEPVLFSGTIAENISYGKPGAARAEIVNAARRANCTFIADFPDGLETHVGARGTQLSGGQKQRIAIARALLKAPDILILDEATSALDAESETLVNEALGKLMKGSITTISIAHRLSTISRSDVIICIGSDGKVAETGPYATLSANPNGAFTKLMNQQLKGAAEPGDESAAAAEKSEEARVAEHQDAARHEAEQDEARKLTVEQERLR